MLRLSNCGRAAQHGARPALFACLGCDLFVQAADGLVDGIVVAGAQLDPLDGEGIIVLRHGGGVEGPLSSAG